MPDTFQLKAERVLSADDNPWIVAETVRQKVTELLAGVPGVPHGEVARGSTLDGSELERPSFPELRALFEANGLEIMVIRQGVGIRNGQPRGVILDAKVWVWQSPKSYVSVGFSGPNLLTVRGARETMQTYLDTFDWTSLRTPEPTPAPVRSPEEVTPNQPWFERHWLGTTVLGILGAVVAGGILKVLGWV